MMNNNQYLCGECGCVFERGGNVMGNLKEECEAGIFKSLLEDPYKKLGRFMGKRRCPECGFDNVAVAEELVRIQLPDTMFADREWTKLEENVSEYEEETEEAVALESVSKDGLTMIDDNPIHWCGKVKCVLKKDLVGNVLEFFQGKLEWFKEKYNESDLMAKIASVAKEAGKAIVYNTLLLYYTLMSEEVPVSKKLIVMAALGYFIAPLDFIPDFLVSGFLDDGSVLMFAINQIMPYVTDDVKEETRLKSAEWFD